ncbi:MAG: TonB-dependent receptor [Acidobacteriota bacterium]|nr:TonB-dependent receptor [Acidobacteriota bacterium]
MTSKMAERPLRGGRRPRPGSALGLAVAFAAAILAPPSLAAGGGPEPALRGVVLAPAGEPLAGARVAVDGREGVGERSAVTDGEGRFAIAVGPGEWSVRVRHPAYLAGVYRVTVTPEGAEVELRLAAPLAVSEAITVQGIRAGEELPVTQRTLEREELERASYGQDVPALLQYTPSMTWTSDSGTGSNYSYFSLRGIQQTRINMTFDGAPLNDPAEHALYFNNFHDFAAAVDSIEIQRGVGTSSVGSPSFGGSVNFASRPLSASPGGDARLVLGSYDTRRGSVGYESGLLGAGFALSGRVSAATTDGYRERSGTRHRTLFLNASWQGERSSLKLVSFSGDVESQLAFLAVDPETLRANRRFNPLAAEERDDFGQDFAQLKVTRALGDDTLVTASLYANGASGWFRLWDDPEARDELLQFGIDQRFVGSMVTASRSRGRLAATVGVHVNDFAGDHTLDVAGERRYANTGYKKTASAFAKLEHDAGDWLLFGDLQARRAEFSYAGDVDLGAVDWSFLDYRIGARRRLAPRLSLYGSLGRAQREPTRMDLLLGEDDATVRHDLEAVRPEEVVDLELGVDWSTPRLALAANLYAMEFTDEIALTGELSEVGLPLRRNVDASYRRGLEVDLRWAASRRWSVLHSANLSRNRIAEWTQFYDVYGERGEWIGSEPITYRDVPPLLSPEAILNLGLEWSRAGARAGLTARYVGDAHLDNTGLDAFRLPSYANLDLRASADLGRWWAAARPRLTLDVTNLLGRDDQFPSGYSYQFIDRDAVRGDRLDGISYYYPLATRAAFLALEVDL